MLLLYVRLVWRSWSRRSWAPWSAACFWDWTSDARC